MKVLAIIGAAAVAAVVWFVLEVWRIGRDIDVTPAYEPTDEELDRLFYGGEFVVGMPTWVGERGPELFVPTAGSTIRRRSLLD